MRGLALVLWFLFSSVALGQYGQLALTVTPKTVLTIESSAPVHLHGEILLAEGDATVTKRPAALIALTTDCKFWDVTARRTWSESGELVEIARTDGTQELILTGEPGEYLVEAIAFDAERGIARASAVVRLGEVTPDPEPVPPGPPSPDSLPVDFDRLASRVNGWAAGVPRRKEYAAIYRAYADRIANDPTLTVAGAGNLMALDIQALTKMLPESDRPKVRAMFENINQDLQGRWPLSKGVLAVYWSCIASGLEAGQ
jgi:hypothetical protein